MDLCALKAAQLRGGRLVFPADLYAALDAFKGKTWLWEGYVPGRKAVLAAKGWPTHQLKDEFSFQRLYFWVETLFADYRKAFPDRPPLTTHMFRKRAFTLAGQARGGQASSTAATSIP